jgi:hypothetical protein
MISLQEFQSAMVTILNRWPRAYSGDQLSLIYDDLKTLNRPDFDRLARHLLGVSRVAPMIPEFRKALTELNIRTRPVLATGPERIATPQVEDFLYHVRENIWANNNFIFIRGPRPTFIVKADHLDNELVKEAEAVKGQRIAEIKKHLAANTYSKHVESQQAPMRKLDYSDLLPDDREPA